MGRHNTEKWHFVCRLCGNGFDTTEALDTVCDDCLMETIKLDETFWAPPEPDDTD